MQKTLKYTIFKTKWGYFGLAGTEYGLLRTHLPCLEPEKIKSRLLWFDRLTIPSEVEGKNSTLVNRVSSIENQVSRIEFDKTFFKVAQEQIAAYFDGACVNLRNISIVLEGFSFFVTSVLTACRNIGFGRTISYSGLAKKLGRPAAASPVRNSTKGRKPQKGKISNGARAIGTALAKNPLPLIIPCHRIVRSDGKIGGFSAPGGKDLKAKLLKHEHAAIIHCKSL